MKLMVENRERPLKTQEIYDLVNWELSDLAGKSPNSHSKSTPQLLNRVGRGRYIYREPNLPMDMALVQEYLEPTEVYEKRPQRRRGSGTGRGRVPTP